MTIFGKTIVAILLAGGVGGGVFYATNFMKNDVPVETELVTQSVDSTTTSEMARGEEIEGKVFTDKDMSFQELMKKTGSYECTVKQAVMGVTTEGKVSIKGEKVSATFSSSVSGKVFETSMITKDGYVYTWSSMTPTTGVKTKVATTAGQEAASTNLSASYAWNGKDIGSYSCVVANISESVFDLPASITFTEVGQ